MYVDMTGVGTSVCTLCSQGQSGCALFLQLLGVVPVVQRELPTAKTQTHKPAPEGDHQLANLAGG